LASDIVIRSGFKEYDQGEIAVALEEMIESSGDWPDSISEGSRVLLKVNMLAAKSPGRGITTHPAVVGAMAELLKRRGCHVAVGDSPGGAVKGVERYWKNCGFRKLAEEMELELVNFESSGSVRKTVNGTEYNIALPVFEYDAVINMCKFKTHMLCRLTNAVKNSYGVVPGLIKAIIHSYAVHPSQLAEHIVNIYGQVKFDLVVMDAILAMDGKGPSTDGTKRWDGILAVARDSVNLDIVMSEMAGLPYLKLDTNRIALERGYGKPFEEITVDGEAVLEKFRIPGVNFYNHLPSFLGSIARYFFKNPPKANKKCTGCAVCAEACPVDAIVIKDGKAVMDRKKCIMCLCCHELCPENALDIKLPFNRH